METSNYRGPATITSDIKIPLELRIQIEEIARQQGKGIDEVITGLIREGIKNSGLFTIIDSNASERS